MRPINRTLYDLLSWPFGSADRPGATRKTPGTRQSLVEKLIEELATYLLSTSLLLRRLLQQATTVDN